MAENTNFDPTSGGGPITKEELIAMVKEYRLKRFDLVKKYERNSHGQPLDDARSCWFSKKAIKDFLADNNCSLDGEEEWGIRIYYGVYPENDPSEYKGLHNLILVATKPKGDDQIDQTGEAGVAYNNGTLCPPRCNTGATTITEADS